jgi:hypothetical protein
MIGMAGRSGRFPLKTPGYGGTQQGKRRRCRQITHTGYFQEVWGEGNSIEWNKNPVLQDQPVRGFGIAILTFRHSTVCQIIIYEYPFYKCACDKPT